MRTSFTILSSDAEELRIALAGDITEDSDFRRSLGEVPPRLIVNCERIRYINSVGVKHWIIFFEELRTQGAAIRFEACAISVVYQLNFVSNFIHARELGSIQLPFLCSSCGRESISTRTLDELRVAGSDGVVIPKETCTVCSSPLVFDENPEEYFYFLRAPSS